MINEAPGTSAPASPEPPRSGAPAARPGPRLRRAGFTAAVLLAGGVFLALFLQRVSWPHLWASWSRLSLPVAGLALLLQAVFIGLRAWRFAAMARVRPPGRAWFAPVAAYSMTCTVFPGGTGELLLPVYLRPLGVGAGAGIGLALGSRILDVAWSAVLAVGFAAWLLPGTARLPVAEGAAAAALAAAAGLALWRGRARWRKALKARLARRPRVARFLAQVAGVFQGWTWAQVGWFSLLTVAMKLAAAGFYFVLARGLGVHMSFPAVAAAMVLYSLFMVVPVQGVAGMGTSDAWWVLGLTLVGVPLGQALVLALTFHLLNLAAVTFWGAGYWAARVGRLGRPAPAQTDAYVAERVESQS